MNLKQFANSQDGITAYRAATGILTLALTVCAYFINDKLSVLKEADMSLRRIEQQIAGFVVAQNNVQKTLDDHDKRLGKLEDWRTSPAKATP